MLFPEDRTIGLPHVQANSDASVGLFHRHKRVDPAGRAINLFDDVELFKLFQCLSHLLSSTERDSA